MSDNRRPHQLAIAHQRQHTRERIDNRFSDEEIHALLAEADT
jgi:hypothetical protein